MAEVAAAIDALLAGQGALTAAEERRERLRLSFNILVSRDGLAADRTAGNLLQSHGWRVWRLTGDQLRKTSLRDLRDFYYRYDINLIHAFAGTTFKVRLSALLSGLTMVFPVFYLPADKKQRGDIADLAEYYAFSSNRRAY